MDNVEDLMDALEDLNEHVPTISVPFEADDLLVVLYALRVTMDHTTDYNATESMIRAMDIWYDRIWAILHTLVRMGEHNRDQSGEQN